MSKNYKRRGYPARELKKKKYHEFNTYEEGRAFFTKHLNNNHETTVKHEIDCELINLRSTIRTLVSEIQIFKSSIDYNKKGWRKEKKEKSTLERRVKSLKRHIKDITPRRQPLIQSTAISRAIKNVR